MHAAAEDSHHRDLRRRRQLRHDLENNRAIRQRVGDRTIRRTCRERSSAADIFAERTGAAEIAKGSDSVGRNSLRDYTRLCSLDYMHRVQHRVVDSHFFCISNVLFYTICKPLIYFHIYRRAARCRQTACIGTLLVVFLFIGKYTLDNGLKYAYRLVAGECGTVKVVHPNRIVANASQDPASLLCSNKRKVLPIYVNRNGISSILSATLVV